MPNDRSPSPKLRLIAVTSPQKVDEDFSNLSAGEYTEMNIFKDQIAKSVSPPMISENSLSNNSLESDKPGLSFWNRFTAFIENPRANFKMALTPEEQLPQLEDLQRNLKEERRELEDNVNIVKDLSNSMTLLIVAKRKEIFKHL